MYCIINLSNMLDRKEVPQIKQVGQLNLPNSRIRKLDNGIEVAMLKMGSQEVVHVEFVFKVGMSQSNNFVLPTTAVNMVSTASEIFSSGEIIEKIDYYGAFLDSSVNMDFITFSVFSLSKYIDKVLMIFQDALINVVYKENDINTYLKNNKEKLKTDLEKVQFLCLREFNKQIFKGHAYGKFIELSDFSGLEKNDLEDFHLNSINPDILNVIVSGNFDNNIYDVLNRSFGKWNGQSHLHTQSILKSSLPEKVYVNKDNAVQSALRIGKVLDIEYGTDEYVVLKVLNTVLGGYFGSRLMSNLREEKGYTYGISSSVISYELATFFVISSEVKGDAEKDALNEIYKEIRLITEELIADSELDTVKNYMLGSLLKVIDGPFLVAEQFKLFNLRDLDLDYLNKYSEMIQNVSSVQLLNCAKKHLNPVSLSEIVVGGRGNK